MELRSLQGNMFYFYVAFKLQRDLYIGAHTVLNAISTFIFLQVIIVVVLFEVRGTVMQDLQRHPLTKYYYTLFMMFMFKAPSSNSQKI